MIYSLIVSERINLSYSFPKPSPLKRYGVAVTPKTLALGKCLMILPLALTKKNLPRKIRTDSLNQGYYTGN
ncbi:MAG: hypothetical protein IJB77_00300, partial [Bacteroidaceae bacterium]|nr:hypothetical protein [Bacteroidaceae bacterium]